MVESGFRVRLEPWAAEYEGAIQLPDDEPAGAVELGVEPVGWGPIRPDATARPARSAFVDGVRRIEHRLLIEQAERTVFGLLGSYGVGATFIDNGARIAHERIERVASTGSGFALPPFDVTLGRSVLRFMPESVAESTPMAPLQGLQNAMRRAEAALAGELAADAGLVFLDGPLTFFDAALLPVVGLIKRLMRAYLPPGESGLLRQLAVGERTPLFLIKQSGGARYSWYARIGSGRSIDSPLTGIVRLEISGAKGLDEARRLADASAAHLPGFASDPAHDPRAPQNLHPIGALESHLRHRLGDALLVRRAIEARLHAEAA
jgi:hypothetical protein